MGKNRLFPDYIFESSWEVCNKVGGIYTVLSTRAKTLHDRLQDKLIFIGPDCWGNNECPYFQEDGSILKEWKLQACKDGLKIKVGRWTIPGNPIAILVDFNPFFEQKNDIYGRLWNDYQVDSLHAYGDYDEASMFSYAAGKVVESYYNFCLNEADKVVYHANEWMTGLGALYVAKNIPSIATIFTTHATSIGRSICGNHKPLYEWLFAYNGDQMASELNMESKHSIEKQTALNVDCFTTVSEITANECKELLDKECDVVLPNGFEDNFVPKGTAFTKKRKEARKKLLQIANCLTGTQFNDDTIIVSTSGRYEFRNKGIDVFVDSLNRLRYDNRLEKDVVAFIEVPGWVGSARQALVERIQSGDAYDTPLEYPMLTHWLNDMGNDNVLNLMRYLDMNNSKDDKVKVIFIPCYLTGNDGVVNLSYYDVVLGNDLCVYPSYYEPWGYTPLEAVAFKVPCITTDLAGFGLWANSVFKHEGEIEDGVKVIHRTDYNFEEVSEQIKDTIVKFSQMDSKAVNAVRDRASKLSKKALWDKFISYYEIAYDIALAKAEDRKKTN